MSAPERIWAWPWEVNPRMGQWEADRSIAGEGEPYVPEAALTAAQDEIARLTAERDAAMAGRAKVKPLWWCYPCRSVGMMHCSDPEHCGCMTTADAEADSWKSWLDDLPLPDDFRPGVDRLQDFITRILAAIQPDTERAEPVAWQWNARPQGGEEWHGWRDGRKPCLAGQSYEVIERPLYTTPQPAPAPQDAARVPEIAAMDDQALCEWIEERHRGAILWAIDPDHFTHQIQITPQTLRKIIAALRAIAAMQKGW